MGLQAWEKSAGEWRQRNEPASDSQAYLGVSLARGVVVSIVQRAKAEQLLLTGTIARPDRKSVV